MFKPLDTTSWLVLIVEDEPDNREVIAETLTFFGAKVRTAQNGVEGLHILQEFTPNLILLDLSMPKMDGWEMKKRVKSDSRFDTIPIIALTAHAMLGDKERALEAGFDGYITKPVAIATLIENIRDNVATPASEPAARPTVELAPISNNGKDYEK